MPALPEGLTTRPLQKSDAHDVFVLMAAQEHRGHRAGRHRGGRHRQRLGQAQPRPRRPLGRRPRRRHPRRVRRARWASTAPTPPCCPPTAVAASAPGWRTGSSTSAAASGSTVVGHARAAGLAGRPAAGGARLPRAVDELGAHAARGRHHPRARAAGGLRRTHGASRTRCVPPTTSSRTPSSSGRCASARTFEDFEAATTGAARVRAVEPARGARPRGAPSSASRWSSSPTTARRRTSTGSPCDATSATAAWPRRCSSTPSPEAREHGAATSELSTDSRTGALGDLRAGRDGRDQRLGQSCDGPRLNHGKPTPGERFASDSVKSAGLDSSSTAGQLMRR